MVKRFAILLLILATLAACGKKGPVRPKLAPVPAAPAALTVDQRGIDFLLSWDIPQRNEDDSPLADLQGFRVERMTYRPEEDCPECREDFQPAAEIDLELLRQARRLGERLFWWDTGLQTGLGYRYRVVPVTRRGQPGKAAVIGRPCLSPPPPPREVAAAGQDQMVRLSWQVPAGPVEIAGYNVYRRRPQEPSYLLPVNARPLPFPSFEDFGLTNGERYLYGVTTVVAANGLTVESAPAEVEAVPQAGK